MYVHMNVSGKNHQRAMKRRGKGYFCSDLLISPTGSSADGSARAYFCSVDVASAGDSASTGWPPGYPAWLPSKAIDSNDCVLVFFSGHGLVDWDAAEKPGYLAAADSEKNERPRTCIAVEWVKAQLGRLPCRHKAIVLDSCYSGTLFERDVRVQFPSSRQPSEVGTRGDAVAGTPAPVAIGPGDDMVATSAIAYYLSRPAFWGVAASRATPATDGGGKDEHSLFTGALLQELEDRCDTDRPGGVFTFSDLSLRIQSRLDSRQDQSRDRGQIPVSGRIKPIEGDGEFLFFPTRYRATPRERARRRVVNQRLSQGEALLAERDLGGALLWFVKALDADQRGSSHERAHRIRIRSVMEQCPYPVQVWFTPSPVLFVQVTPNGKRVVVTSEKETRVWDVGSGTAVSPTLRHDGEALECASLSEDGQRFVIGWKKSFTDSYENEDVVRTWDVENSRDAIPMLEYTGAGSRLAASPDGRRVVIGGEKNLRGELLSPTQGEARIFDLGQRKVVAPVIRDGKCIYRVAFGPTGRYVATVARQPASPGKEEGSSEARVWDATTGGAVIPSLELGANLVRTVALSPSGKTLLTVSESLKDEDEIKGFVRIWEIPSGKPVCRTLEHRKPVREAVLSPNEKLVATVGGDTLCFWDLDSSSWKYPPVKDNGEFVSAAFRADGSKVLTLSDSNGVVVQMWDCHNGRRLARIVQHGGRPSSMSLCADNQRWATGSEDGVVSLWSQASPKAEMARLENDGNIRIATFSPDGHRVLMAGEGKTARIWTFDAGQAQSVILAHEQGPVDAHFSPNGRYVASSGWGGPARIWDVNAGNVSSEGIVHRRSHFPAKSGVAKVVFSPDSTRLLTVDESLCEVRLWDVASGESTVMPPIKPGKCFLQADFTTNGRNILLITGERGYKDETAEGTLWDAFTGQLVGSKMAFASWVRRAELDSEKKRLLVGGSGGEVSLWDVATGKQVISAVKCRQCVNWVAWRPDGRQFATASGTEARLWDATRGGAIASPMEHTDEVQSCSYSADGASLVTAAGREVRVWDSTTGEPITAVLRLADNVSAASFSPDGSRLLAAAGSTAVVMVLGQIDLGYEDLSLLSELLAGRRIDTTESIVPLTAGELRERWKQLIANKRLREKLKRLQMFPGLGGPESPVKE